MGFYGIDQYLVGGFKPSEKYDFVNWDDDIPKSYGKIKHVPNHQQGIYNLSYGIWVWLELGTYP